MLPDPIPEFAAILEKSELLTRQQWSELSTCPDAFGTPDVLTDWLNFASDSTTPA